MRGKPTTVFSVRLLNQRRPQNDRMQQGLKMTGTRSASSHTADASMQQALTAAPLTAPAASPIDPVPQTTLNLRTGGVLTVGAGMEFSTLSAALHDAVNGDTIVVRAGTYVNDFCTVNANVTILAMGGMVHEVATVPPPNGKGLIVDNANLTIRGFSFTGGSDGSPDGNVAGIRYQAGNLNISYCDFHNMQDGILATPYVAGTGTITIDHSEVYDCGTGDGYTHDIYIGAVADFTLTNSYIHNASVGHEVKSRAAVTTIKNNVIADGTTGTASYDIDIPNAGAATITGNIIEKGADASNAYAIHYGGETQYAWANNALLIENNTLIDDYGPAAVAVLNQSSLNGLSVAARIIDNDVYGFTAQNMILGAGRVSGLTMLGSDPGYSTLSPWTDVPNVVLNGTEVLDLVTANNSVSGGTSLVSVNDTEGNNSITGGSGGLTLTDTAGWDEVTTHKGATDALTLGGRNNSVTSAGHDTIVDSGQYDAITASGPARITANAFSEVTLSGIDTVTMNGDGTLHVLATGQVTAAIGANGVAGQKDAGGILHIAGIGRGAMQATVTGGSAGFGSDNGDQLSITGQQGAIQATLGAGSFAITGSAGNDSFTTGSGTAAITLGAGADTVSFGSGAATVNGGTGADTYVFGAGAAGTVTITGFQQGVDTLLMQGFTAAANAVATGSINNGSTMLTLTNGTTIDLLDVALPSYVGSGSSSGGTTTSSGSVTLTTRGNSLVGGNSLLAVADLAGGNTIAGGTGGLQTSAPVGSDVLTTAAGSTNALTLAGSDTLTGAGSGQVAVTGTYDSIIQDASATITLAIFGNTVQGGAGLLTIADGFGGNTLTGGAGGLNASVAGMSDVISTAQGASDTVSASGYGTLTLAGNDSVTLAGNYNVVTATGVDTITANGGWSSYTLDGDDTLSGNGAGLITIGAQADATLISTGAGGSAITKQAGGTLALEQTMPNGGLSAVTVSGGMATASDAGGTYAGISVTTDGAGDSIVAGGGSVSVTSAGPDTIWAGAGSLSVTASGNLTFFGAAGTANISLGSGADTVTFGAGGGQFYAGADDVFNVMAGTGGSDTIFGFSGADMIDTHGFTGNPVASESVAGGNAYVTLTDGTSIEFAGLSQFPHFTV
jgi:hypothetical protein